MGRGGRGDKGTGGGFFICGGGLQNERRRDRSGRQGGLVTLLIPSRWIYRCYQGLSAQPLDLRQGVGYRVELEGSPAWKHWKHWKQTVLSIGWLEAGVRWMEAGGSGRERVHPDASRRIRREAC